MAATIAGLMACKSSTVGPAVAASAEDGIIGARPGSPTTDPTTGTTVLGLGNTRDGLFFVPTGYKRTTPPAFALLLHGAGHSANELMTPIAPLAESRNLVLLAPDSRGPTWDLFYEGHGLDVKFIDTALRWAFQKVAVDTKRMGVIGFSDGASYSLDLALLNGDLFRRSVAYSPGYLAPLTQTTKPEFFITHGTADTILPAKDTREYIVPSLRNAGYSVEYREFNGGHGVTAALMEESINWFVRT
jgi:predicted esterase